MPTQMNNAYRTGAKKLYLAFVEATEMNGTFTTTDLKKLHTDVHNEFGRDSYVSEETKTDRLQGVDDMHRALQNLISHLTAKTTVIPLSRDYTLMTYDASPTSIGCYHNPRPVTGFTAYNDTDAFFLAEVLMVKNGYSNSPYYLVSATDDIF